MKKLFVFLFLFFIASFISAQHGRKYTVYWRIGSMCNDSLRNFSFKILQSISDNKVQTFDKNGTSVTKTQIERNIPKELLESGLTADEIRIALENGDFSVLEWIETEYTEDDLIKMYKRNKDYMPLFKNIKLKKIKPFETKELKIEIEEDLTIDTTTTKQIGSIKNIRLLIPKFYTSSKMDEVLCMIKYEDLKKLNFIPEQQILDQRSFVITTWNGDITVMRGNEVHKLSETITIGKNPDRLLLDKSIFRYFKKSMKLFNPIYPGGGLSDY